MQTLNIIAVLFSPIIAVLVGRYLEDRKERRKRKDSLFTTMMAYRRLSPPHSEFVNALNMIDIVFASVPKVRGLWQQYYDLLCVDNPTPLDVSKWQDKLTELLTAMAEDLGYENLRDLNIQKFYSPVAHGNQQMLSSALQHELLRVLTNTSSIQLIPMAKLEDVVPGIVNEK